MRSKINVGLRVKVLLPYDMELLISFIAAIQNTLLRRVTHM